MTSYNKLNKNFSYNFDWKTVSYIKKNSYKKITKSKQLRIVNTVELINLCAQTVDLNHNINLNSYKNLVKSFLVKNGKSKLLQHFTYKSLHSLVKRYPIFLLNKNINRFFYLFPFPLLGKDFKQKKGHKKKRQILNWLSLNKEKKYIFNFFKSFFRSELIKNFKYMFQLVFLKLSSNKSHLKAEYKKEILKIKKIWRSNFKSHLNTRFFKNIRFLKKEYNYKSNKSLKKIGPEKGFFSTKRQLIDFLTVGPRKNFNIYIDNNIIPKVAGTRVLSIYKKKRFLNEQYFKIRKDRFYKILSSKHFKFKRRITLKNLKLNSIFFDRTFKQQLKRLFDTKLLFLHSKKRYFIFNKWKSAPSLFLAKKKKRCKKSTYSFYGNALTKNYTILSKNDNIKTAFSYWLFKNKYKIIKFEVVSNSKKSLADIKRFWFNNYINFCKYNNIKVSIKPVIFSSKKYSILSSPHVYKKAQEHFEKVRYSQTYFFKFDQKTNILIIKTLVNILLKTDFINSKTYIKYQYFI